MKNIVLMFMIDAVHFNCLFTRNFIKMCTFTFLL